MKRNYFLMIAVLFLTAWIVGCNMLRGAGKDIENAGGSIQKTVNHND
jgi:predicted small secreted protein